MGDATKTQSRTFPAKAGGVPVRRRGRLRERGFALVITVMLAGLLTVMGVAMLTLSTISLRTTTDLSPMRVARANARMAMAIALGELQTQLGDDRRVTADSDILSEQAGRPNMLGVWDSAAPLDLLANPAGKGPDYDGWKKQLFRRWMVSSSDPAAVKMPDFALGSPRDREKAIFSKDHDGFELNAEVVPITDDGSPSGAMAWAISQEATKARMDQGADPGAKRQVNDYIQAPAGPYLGASGVMRQPRAGWHLRENRVLNVRQAALDPAYDISSKSDALAANFTTTSQGLMTDVVNGGVKTDLSLGFELGNSDFRQPHWDEVKNPFYASSGGMGGEVPLYQPMTKGGPISVTVSYPPISYVHKMETGSPPTFQTLRSYYSLYRHLYQAGGEPTAFQRDQTSVYWPQTAVRGSETSVGPVMDRVMFFLSVWVDDNDIVNLVVTPVITLWNPYNVAVESEGCVIYPWMDFPVNIQWKVRNPSGDVVAEAHSWLSTFVGSGDTGEGRSANPYFFCQITGNGDGNADVPIHLSPGEVRVFIPSTPASSVFNRTGNADARTIRMRPVRTKEDFQVAGGLAIPMNASMWQDNDNLNYKLAPDDKLEGVFQFTRDQHNYFVTMEDAGRIRNSAKPGRVLAEVQVQKGKLSAQTFGTPSYSRAELKRKSQPVAVLETYHRTAGQDGQLSDLVYTSNPRQRFVNGMVSASNFAAGPQYESSMRQVADVIGSGLQVSPDGRRSYYGYSNSADRGRDYLSFFNLPESPMISLGALQNADLSDSAFGPASQFGNSWASPFLPRNIVGKVVRRTPGGSSQPVVQPLGDPISPSGLGIYDSSWLLNTALWDSYFFSSITPMTSPGGAAGGPGVYDSDQVTIRKPLDEVLADWIKNPKRFPLRNPRMSLYRGGLSDEDLLAELSSPAGCRRVAAHLMVDGAFNVNSTREDAWCAVLASLRGQSLDALDRSGVRARASVGNTTPVSRLLNPTGLPGDAWNGFRTLSDDQIKALAKEIVAEIRRRGPAQSLGEFVNRRLSSDEMGLKGALQAAIDRAGLNEASRVQRFDTSKYPYPSNMPEPYTGVGTPGWLTQADLLNALAPFITVRSDTFTIRTYGEARDASGKVIATAWYEAVVQRVPEWLETADSPVASPGDVSPASAHFGRRFEIRSFRELSRKDLDA